jgi:hypothetical protein
MQKTSPLMVRLDAASKEVVATAGRTIVLTPDEQLAFWTALTAPVKLTAAQKKLGKLMRGEA